MSKRLFKTMAAVLAIAAAAAGPVRGQNASPDVTLDFTTNDWGLPTTGTNHGPEEYSNGTYSITLYTPISGTNTYKFNSSYLILGRNGAYLELPAFGSPVEKIEVVGNSQASAYVNQNIYVGETAVSTQTTGATGTNTYVINENYRAAGNIYTLKVESAHNTQITYIKVYYASSGGGSTPEPPTPGQNATTYNVTFGGFNNPYMNTTVNVASLPQTFTKIGGYNFYPWIVLSDNGNGNEFTSVSVTSDGNGKVSANMVDWSEMTITVTGTFEGTATIHVEGYDPEIGDVSRDITVSCVAAPVPITVRMAAGTEDAANWTLASGNASVTGTQVLENVMSGSQVTATYNGTTKKVKSVKAVKYVAPAATVTAVPTATEAIIEAGSTAALVNAGVASGGTMMYAVTTSNVQPASTADFSASIPTAEGREAGTYYVWYYVEGDASHTDSEISATAIAVTIAAAETTITWTSSDMTSNFYAYFDGWTNNNTHQGITVTASGDANSGWSQNNIDVNDGSGTITFTSSVGNIKSIVISAVYLNNMDMNVPTGWTANEPWNNPRTLSWSGTASATVNLPLSNMQNIGGISTIVFTLE